MTPGGFYNRHSQQQRAATELALESFAAAASRVPLGEGPAVLADFGCAQGRNSVVPMQTAIKALRARRPGHPVKVFHTDLPGNDFGSLFAETEGYLEPGVFAYAAGRSFYERLFPEAHLTLGWTSIALHWLSRLPQAIPDHFLYSLGDEESRAALAAQSRRDWNDFLDHRRRELIPGGRLLLLMSYADEEQRCGAEGLAQVAQEALLSMVDDGSLPREQYRQITMPVYYRRLEEMTGTLPPGLELEEVQTADLEDVYWTELQRSGDVQAYAAAYAAYTRAFSQTSFFPDGPEHLVDECYRRIEEILRKEPERARCFWKMVWMVLVRA